jgi:hypothetical protein
MAGGDGFQDERRRRELQWLKIRERAPLARWPVVIPLRPCSTSTTATATLSTAPAKMVHAMPAPRYPTAIPETPLNIRCICGRDDIIGVRTSSLPHFGSRPSYVSSVRLTIHRFVVYVTTGG